MAKRARRIRVRYGDCRELLQDIPKQSIDCCVTSPPYWGLRDYQHANQLGVEKTVGEYVDNLVGVFNSVQKALKNTGTLWLNLGDTYKSKVLQGVPWRVAIALQEDGWILRQDIIWHKPNPMPQSVKDRFTCAHEYLFLFAKRGKYYFDQAAVREEATYAGISRGGSTNRYAQNKAGMDCKIYDTRNKRDVWSIKPATAHGKHFAVFPKELVETCVLAGCPENGVVLDPFAGSGTVGRVAKTLNRRALLIEINHTYLNELYAKTKEQMKQ